MESNNGIPDSSHVYNTNEMAATQLLWAAEMDTNESIDITLWALKPAVSTTHTTGEWWMLPLF